VRVAVLSDIHGNLPALEAVLAEVEREGADRVVLNGDIAAGPLPTETLDLLAALGERAVWVHGNAERGMLDPDSGAVPEEDVALGRLLVERHRALIADLPRTVTLPVDGLGTVLFCHASPRRDDEMLLVDSPPARFAAAFAGIEADMVVLGHTHMPFDRLVDRRRVVNPGSVGMPYGHPGAAWALLGPTVELRRTAYDAAEAAARLARSPWEGAARWAEEYVLHHYSDLEALEAFTRLAHDQPA
jgi:putative phosphoesterase